MRMKFILSYNYVLLREMLTMVKHLQFEKNSYIVQLQTDKNCEGYDWKYLKIE